MRAPTIDCTTKDGSNPEDECEGAVIEDENKLSKSEIVDVENRARWLDCIRKHKELSMCLHTYRKTGAIK